MISGGLAAAYKALVPEFERATGHKVLTAYGPSMGTTTNAIPVRLERGEPADVLIMVGYALDDLAKKGKVDRRQQSRSRQIADRGRREIGHAKAGHLYADALKRALLAVKTVAYSDSASGVYVSTEMFGKLGIADEMKDKARKIPATPVGEIVARGDAEIGFQQMSELKPVEGIDIIGPLPDELQKITDILRRHRHRLEGARRRQGADQVSCLACRAGRNRQERDGSDSGGGDELVGCDERPRVVVARLDRAIQYAAAPTVNTN